MSDAFERAAERADTETRRLRQQRRDRSQRKGFRIHATVFGAVQLLILIIWLLAWQATGNGYPWFLYPLLGWGIGLAAHYASVRDSFKGDTPPTH
jgi:fatty acid desaturase